MAHLSLVRHVIRRLVANLPPGIDVENLEAAGTLGLVEAANHFDPSRGVEFKAYAAIRIRGAVLDELRRNCPLPQHILERVARVRRACDSLPAPASVEDLAAATGLSHDETLDCLAAIQMSRPVHWEDAAHAEDSLVDTHAETPPDALDRAEQKRILQEAIASLPERDQLVVTLYYAEELRLREIGEVLDLSEARVSRILSGAVHRLRETLRASQA